jgi:osmoprotectant transport system ATP-binding protein
LIRLEQVSKTFRRADGELVPVVRELDLEVRRGETLCLLGPSGCGKTTTLRLINRLLEPSAGRVLYDGSDTAAADPIRLRRGMGYVVQSGGLFPHMTVAANVGLLCELEGWERGRREERVRSLLALVRLDPAEFAGRYPAELSGGQRQRVGLARSLALDPPVLLMDEPFGALDPITRASVQDELLELLGSVEKTVVLVTHDLSEAFRLGDRVALLAAGRLEQIGTPAEVRANPVSEWVRRFLEGVPDGA